MSSNAKEGDEAGSLKDDGYVVIYVLGKPYKAHRLAWLYVNGEFPAGEIDHIDGNKMNNAIINLRDVSREINQQNRRHAKAGNPAGFLGVTVDQKTGKYLARITKTGAKTSTSLGRFDTPEEAHAAYVAAKRVLHEGCTI